MEVSMRSGVVHLKAHYPWPHFDLHLEVQFLQTMEAISSFLFLCKLRFMATQQLLQGEYSHDLGLKRVFSVFLLFWNIYLGGMYYSYIKKLYAIFKKTCLILNAISAHKFKWKYTPGMTFFLAIKLLFFFLLVFYYMWANRFSPN